MGRHHLMQNVTDKYREVCHLEPLDYIHNTRHGRQIHLHIKVFI